MPLLESIRTKLQHFVTVDDWLKIKEMGWAKKYKVIDDNDITPVSVDQAMNVPEAQDFMKKETEDMPREIYLEKKIVPELKNMCDDLDLEYSSTAKKAELIELLIKSGV